MQNIFTFVLNMSITSCYVILAVIIIRLFLIKAPKKYSYFLWSVVGFRLAIPVSFQSVFSLFSLAPFDVSTAQNNTAGTMDYIPVNIDPNAVSTNVNVGMANVNTIINDALYNASVNSDINITERFVSIFFLYMDYRRCVNNIVRYYFLLRYAAEFVKRSLAKIQYLRVG